MRTPKSLQRLASKVGAHVEQLRFTAHGQSHTGYAIVDADGNELLECEPVYYSNGDRWKVINRSKKAESNRPVVIAYYKSLAGIDKKEEIKPGRTGYKFATATTGRNSKLLKYGVII